MTSARNSAPWLVQPLNRRAARLRVILVTLLVILGIGVSALRLRRMENPFLIPDANQYLRLARGETAVVHQPFASRPLAPLIVRGMAGGLHVSLETAFFALGLFSLLVSLAITLALVSRSVAPRWMLFAVAAVPFWPLLLHGYALPDIPYAALLSCVLLCLEFDRPLLAALMMFPLMLSRESTMLTMSCLLLVGWRRLGVKGSLAAIGSVVAASVVVKHLSAGAPQNLEKLPTPIYMLGKVPWNLSRNLGVDPWSNVYPYLCGAPQWQHALYIGPLRAVGFCQFSAVSPTQAIFALVTEFGLFPVLLVAVWRGRARLRPDDLLTRFCLVYGAICVVLAPMLGTAFQRLFGYAWPLFLVALPRLFPECGAGSAPVPGRSRMVAAVAALLVLQGAMGVVGAMASYGEDVPVSLLLEALGILLLVTPLGTSLRASWSAEDPLWRGKIAIGKTPEQADVS